MITVQKFEEFAARNNRAPDITELLRDYNYNTRVCRVVYLFKTNGIKCYFNPRAFQ